MKKRLLFLSLITVSMVYGMEERVNRIQQNPLLLFPEKIEEREAARDCARTFAKVLHPRLGANSRANQLPRELVEQIATLASNAVVDEWLAQNQDEIERWQNMSQAEKDVALVDIGMQDTDGLRILIYTEDILDRARILLYAGANPNIANEDGTTPLHRALGMCSKELVKILLAVDANPNIANRYVFIPLHEVVYWGDKEVVQILLAAGANPNIANQYGDTPLYGAVFMRSKEIAQILLAAGADRTIRITSADNIIEPELKRFAGMTAAEVARAEGYHDIADFIEQWKPDFTSKSECK